jgi:hypothetical protein
MLNHKPGCKAYIDDSNGQVCLSPDRGYRSGEQVFASYGMAAQYFTPLPDSLDVQSRVVSSPKHFIPVPCP